MIRRTVLPYLLSAIAGICFVQGLVIITTEGDGDHAPFGDNSSDVRTLVR